MPPPPIIETRNPTILMVGKTRVYDKVKAPKNDDKEIKFLKKKYNSMKKTTKSVASIKPVEFKPMPVVVPQRSDK